MLDTMEASARIATYSGYIDVANISEKDIRDVDIAHALSMACRFGGHCRRFYSVAAHCLHCQETAARVGFGTKFQLLALLHDAAEAYWHDLAAPLRKLPAMQGYNDYMHKAEAAIYRKYHLWPNTLEKMIIKAIERSVLRYEVRKLMHSNEETFWQFQSRYEANIPWWKWRLYCIPAIAKRVYLNRLRRLADAWMRDTKCVGTAIAH